MVETCKYCDGPMDHKPRAAKYCSTRCRRKGYYEDNKEKLLEYGRNYHQQAHSAPKTLREKLM